MASRILERGWVVPVVAVVVFVAVDLMGRNLLAGVEPAVRGPVAQGFAAVAAWFAAWPWIRQQRRRRADLSPLSFLAYAVAVIVVVAAVTVVRVSF